MGGFRFLPTRIDGVRIIEPTVTADRRGVSAETYRQSDFAAAGLGRTFVQENQILPRRGVLRGLHFQTRRPQGKLVRAVRGGSWYATLGSCSVKMRGEGRADNAKVNTVGFRVAADLKQAG